MLGKFVAVQTMIIQKLALISEITARSKLKTNITLLCNLFLYILVKDLDTNVM
jgi:hypothetical protein